MIKNIFLFFLFSIIFFFILLISCAKIGYPVYANIFQNGVLYEGEALAEHYSEYLLCVVFPLSMILSAGLTVLISRH